ncbi:MAG: hypothetical protein QOG54_2083 [Actinomycetota bacterium]|jgi:hypothetical protein|nr:hypothetical protein [Actinomycetota bacterium]
MDLKGISGASRTASDLGSAIAEGRDAIRTGLMGTLPEAGRVDLERLGWIAKADRAELWRSEGARDCAEWLSAVFHISNWKARRWIGAAKALERLPFTAAALGNGSLSLDKVVELARFATPADERALVTWARRVKMSSIRKRADAELKRTALEATRAQDARYLRTTRWDNHLEIEAMLPLDEGIALMAAVDRLAHELPSDPDVADPSTEITSIEQRRADALVLLATNAGAGSKKESTVVVYAPIEALAGDGGGCSIDGAGFHPETARRLSCDCHLNIVLEGIDGDAMGIGNSSRIIPRRIRRHVLKRDSHTCTFPGCEMSRFVDIHHVTHWAHHGPTHPNNLITLCDFHHKVVHEMRWKVTFSGTGPPIFHRPDGRVYEPGRPPLEMPPKTAPTRPDLSEAAGYSRVFDLIAPHNSSRKRNPRAVIARFKEERLPDWAREQLSS